MRILYIEWVLRIGDLVEIFSENREMPLRGRGGYLICHVYLCRKGDCVKRFYKWDNAM